ncbi:TRAP-type mannitol/chloroaromatic compound transport system, large permease component [Laribacter hongkongensis HLHK9]|uniref:TRAP-type mannitol/chloroaromatic compound transport system, large permease component n=1 Tax=Laribacter hongkongensis (strain HLHK9) TaxID=557598 RepID=C1D5F0_LARHH|nr:TRAP transporter large permease subunit [Laribacter hongkongensis]ACO75967.1 TRAP-type mannitol/chloroaromatic compound transport system, large permease component [Laribacter hongkongensis HLHK9]
MNHASSSRWAPTIFGVLTLVIAALITSMLLGYSLADTLGHTHPVLNALRHNMAPVMFVSMVLFLLLGYPVAFALAACGVIFGLIGIDLGMLQPSLFRAMPERLWGVMSNDTLLAIPFFTFMGLILERSGMAEDLLDTVGQLFGPVRGGIAYAVILVGAMLAATTGVVAASVISMGLISLPIMLRYGYDRRLASGVIAASGTLAQIIPPSLVLIVLADQLGRSVGDLYKGAFLPGFILVACYIAYVMVMTWLRPLSAPALPPEARALREANGNSGNRSLAVLTLVSLLPALWFAGSRPTEAPLDETVVLSIMLGIGVAFVLAVLNRVFRLGLLSHMAEKTTFVLIPPLGLIFLVLGTIFIGIATPTEGGAMGATGALLMALARKRLDTDLLQQAMYSTAKLTTFVVFILIGARVFSLTFYGVDGHVWVEELLHSLPGGQMGFLIAVNALVFGLAFFLDFFELAFIIVPLLAPVADKLGIDLVWFGVILAVNMQTSFMHPPFGFALFYLRSVAPVKDYTDKITGRVIERVRSGQIYRGAIPFVVIQLVMVGVLIAFPEIVQVGLDKPVDTSNATLTDELALPAEDLSMPEPDGSILDAVPDGSESTPDDTPKP